MSKRKIQLGDYEMLGSGSAIAPMDTKRFGSNFWINDNTRHVLDVSKVMMKKFPDSNTYQFAPRVLDRRVIESIQERIDKFNLNEIIRM